MNTSLYNNDACYDSICGRNATDAGRRFFNTESSSYSTEL